MELVTGDRAELTVEEAKSRLDGLGLKPELKAELDVLAKVAIKAVEPSPTSPETNSKTTVFIGDVDDQDTANLVNGALEKLASLGVEVTGPTQVGAVQVVNLTFADRNECIAAVLALYTAGQ